MSDALIRFEQHMHDAHQCLETFDLTQKDFSLRYVWIESVSAFDFYLTELVSEAGLRLIDKTPRVLTTNLLQVLVPLGGIIDLHNLSPADRLVFFKNHIFAAIQYESFYKPEKVSKALSFIWRSPPKQKWALILKRMKLTGRYDTRTEKNLQEELTLIGDRRDLIAHAVDIPPGGAGRNAVRRDDAHQVIVFIQDLGRAIDQETEAQLA